MVFWDVMLLTFRSNLLSPPPGQKTLLPQRQTQQVSPNVCSHPPNQSATLHKTVIVISTTMRIYNLIYYPKFRNTHSVHRGALNMFLGTLQCRLALSKYKCWDFPRLSVLESETGAWSSVMRHKQQMVPVGEEGILFNNVCSFAVVLQHKCHRKNAI
jgi:hypothetical protein